MSLVRPVLAATKTGRFSLQVAASLDLASRRHSNMHVECTPKEDRSNALGAAENSQPTMGSGPCG
jgi:hypothetical protein